MFQMGILKGNNRHDKQWTITSVHKKSRRKKRHVSAEDYDSYLKLKNKINNE